MRQTAHFEVSNVKIDPGVQAVQVSKNKVGKERKGKEREGMEEFDWHFHPSVGRNGVERSLPNFAHMWKSATL